MKVVIDDGDDYGTVASSGETKLCMYIDTPCQQVAPHSLLREVVRLSNVVTALAVIGKLMHTYYYVLHGVGVYSIRFILTSAASQVPTLVPTRIQLSI